MGNVDRNAYDSAPIPQTGANAGPPADGASAWDRWFPPEASQPDATGVGPRSLDALSSEQTGIAAGAAGPAPVAARPIAARPLPARPISAEADSVSPIPAEPFGAGPRAGSQRAVPAIAPVIATAPADKDKDATTDEDEATDEEDAVDAAARTAPPWLLSTVVHMLLLILLGLFSSANRSEGLQVIELDVYGDDLGSELIDSGVEIDAPALEPVLETPSPEIVDLPEIVEPLVLPPTVVAPPGGGVEGDVLAPDMGYALSGRATSRKKLLLGRYGGNDQTEEAVRRALAWLKRNQRKDGSWSLLGPYEDTASTENTVAATAMALLAFQGAGHTHQQGEYRSEVDRGWKYLLKMQDGQGLFTNNNVPAFQLFYAHGQATIAVCEAYGMTRDPALRSAAERAVQYCIRSQAPAGGWRYAPKIDSDTSVTGWILMGLQSARMAGIDVPQQTFENISKFLDSVAKEGGSKYVYQVQDVIIRDPTMTAEALLCRQYLGWKRDDERLLKGVAYLLEHPIGQSNNDVYYWYYATQVCHHMEGDAWKKWNEAMRRELPATQVKSGPEAGSWNSRHDEWGAQYGRLYTTCLTTYNLEVYYRHLPIYTKVFDGEE